MIINKVPNSPISNDNNSVTDEWRSYFNQITNQLTTFFNSERVKLPQLDTTDMDSLNEAPPPGPDQLNKNVVNTGSILYNKETKNLYANIDGKFQPVDTLTQVATLTDRPTLPADGRFVHVADHPNILYIGIGGAWREITIV